MTETKMRRVYHFVNSEFGLQNVEKRRLKISTLLGLNDPFELLSNNIQNRQVRSLFNIAKSIFDKKFGIICFSNSSQSPVQWAHYADRNKGVCLGFDVRADSLMDVQYIAERVSETNFPTHPDHAVEWMQKILSTKYSQWAYEDESRCFLNLESKIGDHYFKSFDGDIVLKEVQVGFHSEITRAQLAEKLGALSEAVTCFKVRPAFGAFHMVKNENESLWK